MKQEELAKIIDAHKKWVNREKNGVRADLSGADLHGADLHGADLSGADLRWADLSGADLRWADLRGAVGNMTNIKSMQIEKYSIVYTHDMLYIGCRGYPIQKWRNFNDEEITEMDEGALEWWSKWKEWIFNTIELSPASPTKGE